MIRKCGEVQIFEKDSNKTITVTKKLGAD